MRKLTVCSERLILTSSLPAARAIADTRLVFPTPGLPSSSSGRGSCRARNTLWAFTHVPGACKAYLALEDDTFGPERSSMGCKIWWVFVYSRTKWIFNFQGICQLLNSIKSYQKICIKKLQHWFLQVFSKLSSIQFTFFINNLKNEITVQSMDNDL